MGVSAPSLHRESTDSPINGFGPEKAWWKEVLTTTDSSRPCQVISAHGAVALQLGTRLGPACTADSEMSTSAF